MKNLQQIHQKIRAKQELSPYTISVLYKPKKNVFHLYRQFSSHLESIENYQNDASSLLQSKCLSKRTRQLLKDKLPYLLRCMKQYDKAKRSACCIAIDLPIILNKKHERYILIAKRVSFKHKHYFLIRLHRLQEDHYASQCKMLLFNKLEIGQRNITILNYNKKCRITLRELETLYHLGLSTKIATIAPCMQIECSTVNTTLRNMRRKLECFSTPHLINLLHLLGLLSCEYPATKGRKNPQHNNGDALNK